MFRQHDFFLDVFNACAPSRDLFAGAERSARSPGSFSERTAAAGFSRPYVSAGSAHADIPKSWPSNDSGGWLAYRHGYASRDVKLML